LLHRAHAPALEQNCFALHELAAGEWLYQHGFRRMAGELFSIRTPVTNPCRQVRRTPNRGEPNAWLASLGLLTRPPASTWAEGDEHCLLETDAGFGDSRSGLSAYVPRW